ncbi:MAG TPA: GNAT family N-acetyltransferase [Fervidobacterium sp.]|nr:GNAT family N-acetyltransferase [Fervidobacterium sp.]HPT54035.1 GNAT family N-acetyltransferase [Fervidobacterium sp.]HPZ17413.1 GNAT family N-acetyltransferase [Fervidobacterium sp.]HQE48489.1 GNAT family N-acetyltransferase [Fervidobacterium sp.]HUM42264.1 GNAT family N-acetyltransferase [Fervidobacterium sp.]
MSTETIVTLSEYSLIDFVRLVNKIFADYVVPIDWNVLTFKMDARENSISFNDSFIFLSDDIPTGFILNAIRGNRARIDAMGVIESERGKGLAERILKHALHHLKIRNVETTILEVASTDERAVRFYDKNGYRIIRNLHTMILENPEIYKAGEGTHSYMTSDSKVVYQIALTYEIHQQRSPNWQREPISLLLANGRYNYVRVNTNGEEGYFVWGKNADDSAFIVDCGSKSDKLESVIRDAIEYIVAQTNAKLISIVAVPENDKMYNALQLLGFRTILLQYEMFRKL